jgi:hypothetical protein
MNMERIDNASFPVIKDSASQRNSDVTISPSSALFSRGSNYSCSCISSISIVQDRYDTLSDDYDAVTDENSRLWSVVNALRRENQKMKLVLTRAVNKHTAKLYTAVQNNMNDTF